MKEHGFKPASTTWRYNIHNYCLFPLGQPGYMYMCIYKHCVYIYCMGIIHECILMLPCCADPVRGGDSQQAAQKEAESRATGQVWGAVGGMGCSSLNTIHHQPTTQAFFQIFNTSFQLYTMPCSYTSWINFPLVYCWTVLVAPV